MYIKIYSSVLIPDSGLTLDYDRHEDDLSEKFRYEYFFGIDEEEDEDGKKVAEFQEECKALIARLDKTIGRKKYYFCNMCEIYIE